jgi:magnesium transporter
MIEETKKRSRKAGLPPGTLMHIGAARSGEARVQLLAYDEQQIIERTLETEAISIPGPSPAVTWINVVGVHESAVLERIGEVFSLHPLVREDIANTQQRPKLEDYGDYAFVVLKHLRTLPSGEIISEQICLVLGRHFVLTFEESACDVLEPVRKRIRENRGRIRAQGADYLAYALLDAIVDEYFAVLEAVGERIEVLQEELIANPTRQSLGDLMRLRHDMINLRRSVWPLRDVVDSLAAGSSTLIEVKNTFYLRDVYDHLAHVIDTIETYRDMLSGMLDIYLSSINNRMNEIMKVLTIIATIFMPLTFIVGLYGMNFKHMPELDSAWGYPLVLMVMLAIAGGMIWYFKRKDWF